MDQNDTLNVIGRRRGIVSSILYFLLFVLLHHTHCCSKVEGLVTQRKSTATSFRHKIAAKITVPTTSSSIRYTALWNKRQHLKGSNDPIDRVDNNVEYEEDVATTTAGKTTTSTSLGMTAKSDDDVVGVSLSQKQRGGTTMDDENLQSDALSSDSFSWESQWFPVMPTSYLNGLDPDKPVTVSILGRNLVIWKSSNKEWSIFQDVCPHRRAPLSTGQVIAGCLTCRYHGWQFNPDGRVAKFPMQQHVDQNHTNTRSKIRANSFPSQSVGGLLWVFLGTAYNNDDDTIPPLSPEAIPTDETTADAEWMFNRNPISYISMMENTFDPAHSPWTHEQMVGFGGMSFSPNDAIPMERYDVTEPPTILGFSLQHTPYQNSTARIAGPDSLTTRSFVPPCTVSVSSLPFFQTKMWFVPANEYETHVISFSKSQNTRWVKWTRKFPKLQEFVKDTQHTLGYLGDWNYRFLTQDRITMQGQDKRKVAKKLKDLTPDPSDTGVATFQDWLLAIAGGGPFAATASKSTAHDGSRNNRQDWFSHELSFWESHGKYCPRCQRSMRRVAYAKKWATRWSGRFMVASIVSTILFAAGTSLITTATNTRSSGVTRALAVLTMTSWVSYTCLRHVVDWCRQKECRMHSVGVDLWSPHESVFGYQKNGKMQSS